MYPFLQEKLGIVKLVQGGFVFLNIVFGCDDPTYYPSPGRGIEFAHSIFRYLRPCNSLVVMRRSLRIDDFTYNPSESTVLRLSVRRLQHMCKATAQSLKFWRHS